MYHRSRVFSPRSQASSAVRASRLGVAGSLTLLMIAACRAPNPASSARPHASRSARAGDSDAGDPVLVAEAALDALRISVNGGESLRFGLDTGASGSLWVDPALVERLRLPVAGQAQASDGAGRNSSSIDVVRIDRLDFGSGTFRELQAPVIQHVQRDPNDPVYGSLGFELFADYLLTLDLSRRLIRVETGALPEPNGTSILNCRKERGTPVIDLTIGDLRLPALLDTGAESDLLVPLRYRERLQCEQPPALSGRMQTLFNTFDTYAAVLATPVRIGAHAIEQPRVQLCEIFEDVNVGAGLLRRFVVTFDQRNHRVRFVRS